MPYRHDNVQVRVGSLRMVMGLTNKVGRHHTTSFPLEQFQCYLAPVRTSSSLMRTSLVSSLSGPQTYRYLPHGSAPTS